MAAVQHDIVWEDPAANFARLEPRIAWAAAGGARLVVLTEMYATGFSLETERIADASDGAASRFLIEQARRHGVWVCGSVAIRSDGADLPVNRFVLAGPHGECHRYDKIHPFSYAGEHERFAAGVDLVTVPVDDVRLTPFVCYDLRFADVFWETADRTDLYVVVASWPASRRGHWTTLLSARAVENQAYVLGVNRVGEGGGVRYAGDSRLVDPMGEVVAQAAGQETVLLADVDPAVVQATRERFPFLRDRR